MHFNLLRVDDGITELGDEGSINERYRLQHAGLIAGDIIESCLKQKQPILPQIGFVSFGPK